VPAGVATGSLQTARFYDTLTALGSSD